MMHLMLWNGRISLVDSITLDKIPSDVDAVMKPGGG